MEIETLLARKGQLTILELPHRTIVALRKGNNVVTLEGATTREQLVAELWNMCRAWPDLEPTNVT